MPEATYLTWGKGFAGRGLPSSSRRPGPNDWPCAHLALLFLSRLNSLALLRRSLVKVCEADMVRAEAGTGGSVVGMVV